MRGWGSFHSFCCSGVDTWPSLSPVPFDSLHTLVCCRGDKYMLVTKERKPELFPKALPLQPAHRSQSLGLQERHRWSTWVWGHPRCSHTLGRFSQTPAEAWLLSIRFWIVHPTGAHSTHSKLYHPSVPKRCSKQKASPGVLETSEGPKIQNSLSGPFSPIAILSQTPTPSPDLSRSQLPSFHAKAACPGEFIKC